MQIIIITGPAGTGKTTVSKLLTEKFKPSACIEIDSIKHMNMQAFDLEKVLKNGDIPYRAWDIVGQNIGLLAENFTRHNLSVIIEGYLGLEGWAELEKIVKIDHKILLKPNLDSSITRDKQRSPELYIGQDIVESHHRHFDTEPIYEEFTKLDTSNQKPNQTAQIIMDMIA